MISLLFVCLRERPQSQHSKYGPSLLLCEAVMGYLTCHGISKWGFKIFSKWSSMLVWGITKMGVLAELWRWWRITVYRKTDAGRSVLDDWSLGARGVTEQEDSKDSARLKSWLRCRTLTYRVWDCQNERPSMSNTSFLHGQAWVSFGAKWIYLLAVWWCSAVNDQN